jgi:hypothetical protein
MAWWRRKSLDAMASRLEELDALKCTVCDAGLMSGGSIRG